MNDLISVIIPVYNVEPYLDRCMESILNQTYSNLEIILVDDHSNDCSNKMCLGYLNDNRVIVEHGINEGLSGARNLGLNIAHGKFVVFIDSDDYIELNMIENLYNCMISNGADTVIGGFRRAIGNRIEIRENRYAGIVYKQPDNIRKKILQKMLGSDGNDQIEMSVWKVLFSMDIIQENQLRFPDKKYLCEDIIFDFGYYSLAKKVVMSDDTGYCYCLNKESLSQGYQKDKFERINFQASEMRLRAEEAGFGDEAQLRIDNFYIGNLIHHMKTMAANAKRIGRRACLDEYWKISTNNLVRNVGWEKLEHCYNGRDKIPYYLFRHNNIKTLYYYLRLLTAIRGIVR